MRLLLLVVDLEKREVTDEPWACGSHLDDGAASGDVHDDLSLGPTVTERAF